MTLGKASRMTAALLAAVFLWWLVTLPSRPAPATGAIDESLDRRTIAGAFHVHSNRSDGVGDPDTIAAAAARAGLRFVILTDHGDATRAPEPPAYLHGVLVVDAVEISTNEGHYIAFDMPPAPYPLGGDARAVVEDVRRLGGFGIAAHPDSRKRELKWSDVEVPIDGLEWLNIDSEWRDEARSRLARALLDYPVRKGPALATLLDRPSATLERWDALTAKRTVVGLAGHDAHGGWGTEDRRAELLPDVPSYEASFETFSTRAVLERAATGDAAHDWPLLKEAFRAGRTFTAIDAVASPARVDFRAAIGERVLSMGESAPFGAGATITFRSSVPAGSRTILLRGGQPIAKSANGQLQYDVDGPGAYRVEVSVPNAPGSPPVPWIVTNPIYFTAGASSEPVSLRGFTAVADLREPARIEKESGSTATVSSVAGHHTVEFALRPGERVSQYVAIALSVPAPPPSFDALSVNLRSAAPMRVSVQIRFGQAQAPRWGTSVYVSPEAGRHIIDLRELHSLDGESTRPPAASATSILFVVDLTNATPGLAGKFEVSDVALGGIGR